MPIGGDGGGNGGGSEGLALHRFCAYRKSTAITGSLFIQFTIPLPQSQLTENTILHIN